MTAILTASKTIAPHTRRAILRQRAYARARADEFARTFDAYTALGGRAFSCLHQEGMAAWVESVGRGNVVCTSHHETLLTEAETAEVYPPDELDDWREILGGDFFCRREADCPQIGCCFVDARLWEQAAGRVAMTRAIPVAPEP